MVVVNEQLEQEALKLAPEERAKLAASLISSLDSDGDESITDEEWREAWAAEAERRLAEIEADPSLAIPAEEVFRRIRARFK